MLELSDDRGGRVVIAPPAPNRSAVVMTQRDAGIFPAKARRVSPDELHELMMTNHSQHSRIQASSSKQVEMRDPRDKVNGRNRLIKLCKSSAISYKDTVVSS
jgi:hypothetical protein